jgi:hypothetical protein
MTFVREAARSGVAVVEGDVTGVEAVAAAVSDQDAVCSALGPSDRRDTAVLETGIDHIAAAHNAVYDRLRGSGLDRTLVCPPRMPNGRRQTITGRLSTPSPTAASPSRSATWRRSLTTSSSPAATAGLASVLLTSAVRTPVARLSGLPVLCLVLAVDLRYRDEHAPDL